MVNITPLVPDTYKVIEKYGDGGFTISGDRHEGSVIVFPENVLTWKAEEGCDATTEFFAYLYEDDANIAAATDLDMVLLGSGKAQQTILEQFNTAFRENNIRVEIMDTGAACRTYNILLSEGRKIAAALVAI